MTSLILASGSPVRRKLLAAAGYAFRVVRPQVDEVLPDDGDAVEVAAALALEKARSVLTGEPDATVIGADQVLLLPNGALAGKTDTREEARARIIELSGRTHRLISVAAVVTATTEELVADVAEIRFRALGGAEVERYLDLGEWRGTAGSYLVESRGIHLMEHVVGDHFTVLGLPLLPVVGVLRGLGISPLNGARVE
ncbi:MAG: Maf family protein [Myxococcota bacterium]